MLSLSNNKLEENMNKIKELIKSNFSDKKINMEEHSYDLIYGINGLRVKYQKLSKGIICQIHPKESILTFYGQDTENEKDIVDIDLEEVDQILMNKDTKMFQKNENNLNMKNDKIITFSTKSKSTDITFYKEEDMLIFLNNVLTICSKVNNADTYEKRIWNFIDKDLNGYLTLKEFEYFGEFLKLNKSASYYFKKADVNNDSKISYEEFLKFFETFNSGKEFKPFFDMFSKDKKNLKFLEIKNFLKYYQKENYNDYAIALLIAELKKSPDIRRINEYNELVNEINENFKDQQNKDLDTNSSLFNKLSINLKEFKILISSKLSNVLDINKINQPPQDYRPMTDYFIKSSHNTYLCAHQLYGDSNEEMYKLAMDQGYKLVEMDCYNGRGDDIDITHGYTLVDTVKLVNVLEILRNNAFQSSNLPVILSVENHLDEYHQQVMAKNIKEIFGKNLYILDENHLPEDLPPLRTMKQCFIVKTNGRRPKGYDRSKILPRSQRVYKVPKIIQKKVSDVRMNPSEPNVLNKEDKEIIFSLRSHKTTKKINKDIDEEQIRKKIEQMQENSKFIQDLLVLRGLIGTKFDIHNIEKNNYQAYEFVTLKSTKFEKYEHNFDDRNKIINFSSNTLMKAYPQKFDSTNYNPIKVWMVGGQVAAMNIQQLNEDFLMINTVFFLQNQGCGYVLKPKKLLPESLSFETYSTPKGKLTLKVISIVEALYLIMESKLKIKDDYKMKLVFKLYGSYKDDENEEQSVKIYGNFYEHEVENKEIKFNVYESELSCVVLNLIYQNEIIGRSAIPLCMMKEGMRRVSLYDLEQNECTDSAVYINIKRDFKIEY